MQASSALSLLPSEQPSLRELGHVFRTRAHAGDALATLLEPLRGSGALVLGIPAGGVAVAAAVAERLDLLLDVAVVSKITLPWDSESGVGAVAFDGTLRLNEDAVRSSGISRKELDEAITRTRLKVQRRVARLRAGRPPLLVAHRPTVLVDDGLASGFTMRVAVEALRNTGGREIIVAVPTGHLTAVERVRNLGATVVCANIRSGRHFAVADAYLDWHEESEDDVERVLATPRF